LPLFAALPPAVSKPDPITEALDAVDPDALSGRDALALIYRLKELARQQ
jgi:hypothetical protein